MEVYKCSMCNMQFRTIEQLPGRWRLRHHERINHLAKCEKCDKTFVSYTHATVHLYQCHNVHCIQCGQECANRSLGMIYDYTQVEKDAGWLATCPPDFVISGVYLFDLWRRKGV